MEITPSLAKIMLGYNSKNRSVKPSNLDRITAEMDEGRFVFNGDAIRFSSKQTLLDGQHRLIACCDTGISFTSVVIEGIDQDAFKTIDTGSKREPGDVLSISGFQNCKMLAAAVRLVEFIESGNRCLQSVKLTGGEILGLAEKMEGIADSGHFAVSAKSAYLTTTATCALHYLFEKIDSIKAASFFLKLKNGDSLNSTHPILILRNMLDFSRKSTRRYPPETVLALTIKAWNHFRRGNQIKSIRYRDDEEFPKIDTSEIK
jgi:hypothetical protein